MKDDPEFNIRFVKCVEKQPCLYNYNVIEYSNRDEQERAWQDVAFEMKATGKHFNNTRRSPVPLLLARAVR